MASTMRIVYNMALAYLAARSLKHHRTALDQNGAQPVARVAHPVERDGSLPVVHRPGVATLRRVHPRDMLRGWLTTSISRSR